VPSICTAAIFFGTMPRPASIQKISGVESGSVASFHVDYFEERLDQVADDQVAGGCVEIKAEW